MAESVFVRHELLDSPTHSNLLTLTNNTLKTFHKPLFSGYQRAKKKVWGEI